MGKRQKASITGDAIDAPPAIDPAPVAAPTGTTSTNGIPPANPVAAGGT
jgi:hypothetical protein